MKGVRIKVLIFLVATGAALWSLWPSYKLYFVLPARFRALEARRAEILRTADSTSLRAQLIAWDHDQAELQAERIRTMKSALHLGLDIVGGMHLTMGLADTVQLPRDRVADAIRSDIKVIEGRVDKLGVVEPVIQHAGDRLIVQLPGVVDEARAESLIGKTAVLDFRILADDRRTEDLLTRIDNYFKARQAADTLSGVTQTSFRTYISMAGGDLSVDEQYYPIVRQMLAEVETTTVGSEYRFFFGPRERSTGGDIRRLYLLRREPELSTADGKLIDKAFHRIYTGTDDPSATNTFIVDFTLSRSPNPKYNPVAKFASTTQRYINKRMAIVLDSVVMSAPVIKSKIPDGSGMITTGDVSGEKARDLAIVLATGSLQAPLKIESAERIGPSLGADSIRRGVRASLVGAVLVIIFMLIYYNLSGFVAVFALTMNMLYLLAILGGVLHATLTLPGLAGMALTVGMAVDANVLIFERIREELRWGKSVRAAIDNGYQRALTAIIDGNLTTIISAIFLFQFGTGPVKGYAVTLIIGIAASMFTAVFVSRLIFELTIGRKRRAEKMSI
ncbi:MAG: protein translocase subunit SecD [candidate division WOR-3 bacterium]